jgi:chemotaxis methyl-accepting protein methylase
MLTTIAQEDMTDAECELWRDFIQRECGLLFPESRRSLLKDRLAQRMHERGIRSYSDYYHHVLFNDHAATEWRSLLALLLNHESSFFRHAPSFSAVTDDVLPLLLNQKVAQQSSREIRMWSAACSAGQEAYSLAMCFQEAFRLNPVLVHLGPASSWDVSILGTDIGGRVLQQASHATYRAHELRGLDPAICQKYFRSVEHRGGRAYQLSESLRRTVAFHELNLLDIDNEDDNQNSQSVGSTTHIDQPFDLIFCQNVLIYFSTADRVRIATGLSKRLAPGGFLCLGPADWLGQPIAGTELIPSSDAVLFRRHL